MKVGRFILKAGSWLTAVIFLSLSALFLSVWTWPATLINTKNFERAVGFLAKKGMVIKYETADLKAESHSFFVKWVGFGAKNLCFSDESMGLKTCFVTVKLSASVDIKGWLPKYHVGPIALRGGDVSFHPKPSDKKEEPKSTPTSDEFWPKPPAILEHVTFESIFAEVLRLDYVDGKTRAEGAASLDGRLDGKGSKWDVKVDAGVHLDKDPYSAHGTVTLKSVDDPWFGPYVIDTDLVGNLPGAKKATVALHGKPRGKNGLDYALDASYVEKGRNFSANIIGKGDPNGVDGMITGSALKVAENLPKVSIQECEFAAKQDPEKKKGKHFTLNCPANLTGYFPRFKNGPYEKIFEKIQLLVKSDMRLMDLPGKPGSLQGKLELLVDPFLHTINEGHAALSTNITGLVRDFPNQLRLDSDLKVGIKQFERVVKMSQHYPWAIPEPANSLKGTIDLHVTGKGELMREGGELPIELKTRLSSEGQVVNIDGDGKLKLKPFKSKEAGAHLDFTLVLSEVQLALPHLNVEAPPRIAPDARIRKYIKPVAAKTAKAEKSSFTYNVQIVTPNGTPLRIVSNLAKDKIPIAIFLHGSDKEPFNGSVRILTFPVEMFRRTATIKHLDIRMAPNSKDSEIDGDIQVAYTDYTIHIKLLGLLDQPQIKFLSDPPLPEDQVIAVLLFGKKPGGLTADQAASVGSTKAAVEDSAVTLASMYLLASTPVESVGYDPASHVFTAKVRLADGTSLNVGSDMKQLNQIGIRKQLGGHWTITTYLEHPLDLTRSLSAFLEWTNGY